MSRYNPPAGYRLPAQAFSRYGYDGNLWVPGSLGKGAAIMPSSGNVGVAFNFGAYFAGIAGLNVRAYFRSDLGVSGSVGTGKTIWANQLGDGSNMVPSSDGSVTNGLGSVVSGVNGYNAIQTDGATQTGIYTFPSQPDPAVTNCNTYTIEMVLSTATAGAKYMHSAANNVQIYMPGSQVSPSANMQLFGGAGGPLTTGALINQLYRIYSVRSGGVNDVLRVGAHAPAASSSGTATAGTSWGFGGAYNATSKSQLRTLVHMHIEGPRATFLGAVAGADAGALAMYSGLVEF